MVVTLPSKQKQHITDPLEYLDSMHQKLQAQFERNGFKISVNPQNEGPPRGRDVNVRIVGSNFSSLHLLADELWRFMQEHSDIGTYLVGLEDDRGHLIHRSSVLGSAAGLAGACRTYHLSHNFPEMRKPN